MTREEILSRVANGKMSIDDASKALAAADRPQGRLYCKVSGKGAVSLYGLQRMPVTLYVEQWERLVAFSKELLEFAHKHENAPYSGKRKIDGKGEPVAYTAKVTRKVAAQGSILSPVWDDGAITIVPHSQASRLTFSCDELGHRQEQAVST